MPDQLSVTLLIINHLDVVFVRLFVLEVGGKLVPKPKQQQEEAFIMIYDICLDMMDIQVVCFLVYM
jgi:hypothetical protein